MSRRAITISLPEKMRVFVVTRTFEMDHSSVSEYIRELIRRDQRVAATTPSRLEIARRRNAAFEQSRLRPGERDRRY